MIQIMATAIVLPYRRSITDTWFGYQVNRLCIGHRCLLLLGAGTCRSTRTLQEW